MVGGLSSACELPLPRFKNTTKWKNGFKSLLELCIRFRCIIIINIENDLMGAYIIEGVDGHSSSLHERQH